MWQLSCVMIVALKNLTQSTSALRLKAAGTLWILENDAQQQDGPTPAERGLYSLSR